MRWFTILTDKSGSLGAFVAAMGCTYCFPALGALGASLGLGFLAQWEEFFVTTLIPVFVGLVVFATLLSFVTHRIWWRLLLGLVGPTLVLTPLLVIWNDEWATTMLTTGIVLMIAVSILDVFKPPVRICANSDSDDCGSEPAQENGK